MPTSFRRALIAAALMAVAAPAQLSGPSTAAPCYILPDPTLRPGAVATVALLTVGDSVGGYRMIGIPDGIGAFLDASGATTVTLNHELAETSGIVRVHGSKGAIVSRWTIDPTTLAVLTGRDHSTAPADVHPYDRVAAAWTSGTFAWDRFCSADLAPPTAFAFGGLGTDARIHLTGEEARPPGRHGSAWAHVVTGAATNQTWELPHLGQCAYENAVASPHPQTKTVVVCLDDSDLQTNPSATSDPSEVYVYVGAKQATGNDVEKAGLVGGTLYGVRVSVNGVVTTAESNPYALGTTSYAGSGTFELVNLGDASTFIGVQQQAASVANDVFRFQRVEDGAWDPRPGFETDFYFATPATVGTNSRLWRLRFTDIAQPELGGQIDVILAGAEGHHALDNVCVDTQGRVFLQEDPGGGAILGKIWMYDLTNGRLIQVAAHAAPYFVSGGPTFLTTNEESSGVVPAFDLLGDGWYLMSCQIHMGVGDTELVEYGQLLAMYVDPQLGRTFDLWYTSPTGPGSLRMHRRFGAPNGLAFTAVALAPGNFPNGAFFGVDLPFLDLVAQALYGPPFLDPLDATGASLSAIYQPLPSGLTLYSVALDDVTQTFPMVSAPIAYVVP